MAENAILIGYGGPGIAVVRRSVALAGDDGRVLACEPDTFLECLERRARQIPGNSLIMIIHVVQTDNLEDMRAALDFMTKVIDLKRSLALNLEQWIVALIGREWTVEELSIRVDADLSRPPYSLLVISRSNEALALLSDEAELAMAADLVHALSGTSLRRTLTSEKASLLEFGAGVAAAYYRKEPLVAGILAQAAILFVEGELLARKPSNDADSDLAKRWFSEHIRSLDELLAELALGESGQRLQELIRVDPDTAGGTEPEVVVDALKSYVDLMVNDRLPRVFGRIDEAVARRREALRQALVADAMGHLRKTQNLDFTVAYLEGLRTDLEERLVELRGGSRDPELPVKQLEQVEEAARVVPYPGAALARAIAFGGLGVAAGIGLLAMVAPAIALAVGAMLSLVGAGGVGLGAWARHRRLAGERRRFLDELQDYLSHRLAEYCRRSAEGLLIHLCRLIQRPDDPESGLLGGIEKMRDSGEKLRDHLNDITTVRFHEDLRSSELSIFLPSPEDLPTAELARAHPLPEHFPVGEAVMEAILSGMSEPCRFAADEVFARYYERGRSVTPQGLWHDLAELLQESGQSVATAAALFARGTGPLVSPSERAGDVRFDRFSYLPGALDGQKEALLAQAPEKNASDSGDPNALFWVSLRRFVEHSRPLPEEAPS